MNNKHCMKPFQDHKWQEQTKEDISYNCEENFKITKEINVRWWRAYISVELPNKAWEIVVLEVFREKGNGKCLRIPNNKAVAAPAPRDYVIGIAVFNYVISFCKEWRRANIVKPLPWLRRCRIGCWWWTCPYKLLPLYSTCWMHLWKKLNKFKKKYKSNLFNNNEDINLFFEVMKCRWTWIFF